MRKRFISATILITAFCVTNAVAQEAKKSAYAILFDNTGSLRMYLDIEKDIGKVLIKRLVETGPVSLFQFRNDQALFPIQSKAIMIVGSDWSQSEASLGAQVNRLSTVSGLTTLMDAIRQSAEKIDSKVNLDKNGFSEKVLIILTDGEDRASEIPPQDLIMFLKQRNIKVYAIGFGDGKGLFDKTSVKKARGFLKTLTEETGGRVIFPKEKQTAGQLVRELFTTIKSK